MDVVSMVMFKNNMFKNTPMLGQSILVLIFADSERGLIDLK